MKLFVAGASGAVGRALLPRLILAGHEEVAQLRSLEKAPSLIVMGAQVVFADALERLALIEVIHRSRPEAIIHQQTALAGVHDVRRMVQQMHVPNRLRSEATDTILEAGREVGVRQVIAQSYCGCMNLPGHRAWPVGGWASSEDWPDADNSPVMKTTKRWCRHQRFVHERTIRW